MPIVPGTSHTVTKNQAVGGVTSVTIDPFQPKEVGRPILADDYTTLTIAQSGTMLKECQPILLNWLLLQLTLQQVLHYKSPMMVMIIKHSEDQSVKLFDRLNNTR